MEQIGPGGVAALAPAVGFFCITIGTITPPGSLHPGFQLIEPNTSEDSPSGRTIGKSATEDIGRTAPPGN
jgi:hypothetical protein